MRLDAPVQSSGIHRQNGLSGSACGRQRGCSWKCCCWGWAGGISRKRCHSKWQPQVAAVFANCSLLGYLLGGQEPSAWQSQPCLLQMEKQLFGFRHSPRRHSIAVPAGIPASAVQQQRLLQSILCSARATPALLPQVTRTGDVFPPHHLHSNSLSFARSSLSSDYHTHTTFF